MQVVGDNEPWVFGPYHPHHSAKSLDFEPELCICIYIYINRQGQGHCYVSEDTCTGLHDIVSKRSSVSNWSTWNTMLHYSSTPRIDP